MRYKKLTGLILKKQNYKESDQIVTLWTKEEGKIRCLAKGIRLAKSRMVYSLSDLSLVSVEVTSRNLPTIISAATQHQFTSLTTDLKKMATAFYASELMLKMTADEHPNPQAYQLLLDFLTALEKQQIDIDSADQFAINLAEALGFGPPRKLETHKAVKDFIEDVIERQIKSEPFLMQI